jgi:hypothetical protein
LTRCCLQLPSLAASNEDLLAPGAAQRRRQVPRLNRATRGKREPPSDAEIERGLRERAVNSARDAEVLLRWRQTVRPPETGNRARCASGGSELLQPNLGQARLDVLERVSLGRGTA